MIDSSLIFIKFCRNNCFTWLLTFISRIKTNDCEQMSIEVLKHVMYKNIKVLCLENLINLKMFPSFLPNSEVNSGDPVLAGHTIKGRDFQEKYLNKLFRTPQIVGVFLQDKVSSYV